MKRKKTYICYKNAEWVNKEKQVKLVVKRIRQKGEINILMKM